MSTLDESVQALNSGGRELWDGISENYELDEAQKVQLLEACRAKDRCDQLDELLRGHISVWAQMDVLGVEFELVVDKAFDKANTAATLMKQMIAAMRLPDEAGKRPTFRSARGAVAPKVPGGAKKLTALEKARLARDARGA